MDAELETSVCPLTRGPHRWAVVHRKAPADPLVRTECQGCGAVQVPSYPLGDGGRQ